jgi:hypothetical protein
MGAEFLYFICRPRFINPRSPISSRKTLSKGDIDGEKILLAIHVRLEKVSSVVSLEHETFQQKWF